MSICANFLFYISLGFGGGVMTTTVERNNEKVQQMIYQINSLWLDRVNNISEMMKGFSGDRKYEDIFGWNKTTGEKGLNLWLDLYRKGGIARRIVRMWPSACWSSKPQVTDDENSEKETKFERDWNTLEKIHRLLHYFKRADMLSGLGQYSVIYLGISDAKTKDQLKEPVKGTRNKLSFVRPYLGKNAIIKTWYEDISKDNYGMPQMYELKETIGNKQGTPFQVHESRIIHIAEDVLENDLYGVPILEPAYHLINDLLFKIIAGSAEMFWLNARGGMGINIPSGINPDSDLLTEVRDSVDEYVHELKRNILTIGTDIKPITHQVSSPKDHVDCIMRQIAATYGIPERILSGSERGELASAQDNTSWIARKNERIEDFCIPVIIRQFIDKAMKYGFLPLVPEYFVKFPQESQVNPVEQADIADKTASAIEKYSRANLIAGDRIVKPRAFVEEKLQMEYIEPEKKKDDEENDVNLED